jgi:predicted dehydrogenase
LPAWGDAIVAGVEPDPERRTKAPHLRWFDSVDALRDVDFVDICTPPSTHAALISHALRRGFHVLCEKPLVTRSDDFNEIAALAESLERVVYTVDNWRNAPILARATALIREGAIGEVRNVKWTVLRNGPSVTVGDNWRLDPEQSGGGISIDHGWHAVYVLHDWIGVAPTRVRGHLEWLPVEQTALMQIDYPHASAEIFLTWKSDERRNLAVIEGTRGTIRIDGDTLDVNGAVEHFAESLTAGSHHADWFPGVIERFVSEVETPSLRGRNLEVAAICANVLAAARQAEEICTS